MRFPFLASLIVFIIWLTFTMKKAEKKEGITEKNFWEKEARANSTRKKSLDNLSYIHIPFQTLPMETASDDSEIVDCTGLLKRLSEHPIVNLTGISNTDLKLLYGAANITVLTEYDQNYTLLARTLQKWASLLYQKGYTEETKQVLEFAVSTGTDVSGSYKLLAEIYKNQGNTAGITSLLEHAKNLNSAMKKPIVRILQESDPSDGSLHS